ncbi:HAMP domain-containing protein [Hymenobacter canadensis]|uniref:HAMP domain-containing protein n=1 Tax=Hymenobacter canadensis TaxID=2999067 RepID=A0ABY7LP41_9BACT|nr:HAMP domain-containing protein [Hymenobacter canadensis]WBA41212.1 HAMP domain-containing protein [Hymenobacter canadensis]
MARTIKARLTLGLSFLFVIILLLSGVGAYFLYQLSRSSAATLQDNYRSVAYARAMSDALSDLRAAQQADPVASVRAEAAFRRSLRAEQGNITEPGEQELADSLAASFGKYAAQVKAPAGLYQQVRGQVGRVATLNLRAIEQQSVRTRRIANRTIGTLGLLATVGILATLSFIFSFPDYLTKPVQELTAGIRRVAEGHYDQRLPVRAHDEFAPVAQAFNDMARRLEGYETADGTPRIDSSGPLDLITRHHRPGTAPAAPAELSDSQRHLAEQLQQQARQLERTAKTLLRGQG